MRSYEINEMTNCVKDNVQFKSNKPTVCEVFSALVKGKDISGITNGDAGVALIKELNARAEAGDVKAMSELNAIRSYVINPILLEEVKLLGFFGDYENVGYGESIEREVRNQNINTREQAANGDVPLSFNYANKYPVGTKTLSAGYQVDYRKAQYGDMSAENILMENIKTDMRNKAAKFAMDTVVTAVTNAPVKNYAAGITRANVTSVLNKARPFGRVNFVGDTAAVIKLNDIATYSDNQGTPFYNISQEAMNEIASNAYVSKLMGAGVFGIDNAYDLSKINTSNWFDKVGQDRYIFVIPTGIESPIKLWTRGGLTSMTGNDVTTGRILTRYDLEVAADVAKGQEYKIGVLDTVSG